MKADYYITLLFILSSLGGMCEYADTGPILQAFNVYNLHKKYINIDSQNR